MLFGSRARGDARDDSDLDFLVIEKHLDSKLSEMVRLRDALPPLAVPVDASLSLRRRSRAASLFRARSCTGRSARAASLSRPELEEALLLLRKAQEDADAVKKLLPDTDIADSVVGFHAQQAAEKALKAVLAASGDDFPWTHDLRHLMDRLQTAGTPLPASLREVRVLIPWAVEFGTGRA